MLASKLTTVHVYSFVPRMVEVMRKTLPNFKVCPVSFDDNSEHFIKKKITEKELLELQEASVLITDCHLISQIYQKLPNLLWAQLTYAGIDRFSKVVENSVPPTFPVTRCISFYQQVVEYAIAWIINNERGFHQLHGLQKEKIWARNMGKVSDYHPSLKDLTIGIVGVGEIGSALAGCLKVFNCKVLGFGRSRTARKGVQLDNYWSGNQLPDFLAECGYIVNLLPSTPETRGFFGGNVLESAKKKPVFINIGRGDVISNTDVIKALENGWISKAILDVFTEEPLPQSSPLWLHPKVIITSHLGGVMTAEDVARSFKENVENILMNKPLKNQVDWQKGY